MEPQEQDDDEFEQGADTQEPTPPNILVEFSTQIWVEEPEVENIPDFNEEVYAVTLEPSWGIELTKIEPQKQDNDKVDQDVVTQELTSPEIYVDILKQKEEINLEMDIILDLDLGEDEKM